jgi:hypothetical protein
VRAQLGYFAVPRSLQAEELRRIELLCVMSRVGLILFDAGRPELPDWTLRVRPPLDAPDPSSLNDKLALLRGKLYI